MDNVAETKEKNQKKVHLEKARYLHQRWKQMYEGQHKGGDSNVYYCLTKCKHPKFKDFQPLDVERYLKDWQLEHGEITLQ